MNTKTHMSPKHKHIHEWCDTINHSRTERFVITVRNCLFQHNNRAHVRVESKSGQKTFTVYLINSKILPSCLSNIEYCYRPQIFCPTESISLLVLRIRFGFIKKLHREFFNLTVLWPVHRQVSVKADDIFFVFLYCFIKVFLSSLKSFLISLTTIVLYIPRYIFTNDERKITDIFSFAVF